MSVIARLDTDKLDQIRVRMQGEGPTIVETAAKLAEAEAKINAPYKTGFLTNSIKAEKKSLLTWFVNVYAHYGKYQELGTSKMSPRPYLTPAVEHVFRVYKELWKRIFQ